MKKSTSAMMKMEMGTPKSPIKRRACGDAMPRVKTLCVPTQPRGPPPPCPCWQRAPAKTSTGECDEFARSQPAPSGKPSPWFTPRIALPEGPVGWGGTSPRPLRPHLAGQEHAVLELAEEEGHEEGAGHEDEGQQRRVGLRHLGLGHRLHAVLPL